MHSFEVETFCRLVPTVTCLIRDLDFSITESVFGDSFHRTTTISSYKTVVTKSNTRIFDVNSFFCGACAGYLSLVTFHFRPTMVLLHLVQQL